MEQIEYEELLNKHVLIIQTGELPDGNKTIEDLDEFIATGIPNGFFSRYLEKTNPELQPGELFREPGLPCYQTIQCLEHILDKAPDFIIGSDLSNVEVIGILLNLFNTGSWDFNSWRLEITDLHFFVAGLKQKQKIYQTDEDIWSEEELWEYKKLRNLEKLRQDFQDQRLHAWTKDYFLACLIIPKELQYESDEDSITEELSEYQNMLDDFKKTDIEDRLSSSPESSELIYLRD